jgi:hypothetical protein
MFMNKLACGIAALGLLVGIAFAQNSYYILAQDDQDNLTAWGTNAMGFFYPKPPEAPPYPSVDNPGNPYSSGDSNFFNDGVLKILNGTMNGATYPGIFLAIENGTAAKKIADCQGGFSYWYRGGAHQVNLEFPYTLCGSNAGDEWGNKWIYNGAKTNSTAASWTKVTLTLSEFAAPNASGCTNSASLSTVDLSKITDKGISWGTENGSASGYNLMIGNVVCLASGETSLAGDVAPTADFVWVEADDELCNAYCDWGSGCGRISTDKNGIDGTPTETCGAAIDNCKQNSPSNMAYSDNACTIELDESTPTIVSGRSVGLTVVPNGNALHIISEKGATVELFSLAGAKVFSSKIAAGNSILSLEKQRQGVYYAVITSGSQKQTVKVVLK